MRRIALMVAALLVAPLPAFALSNAASYLVSQEIAEACNGGPGRYDPAYVIERDLDGDGRADLLIAHEGIECDGPGRSGECGMMVCSFKVWLRRGELLTLGFDNLLGADVTVGPGPTPEIRWLAHDGTPMEIRWDGTGFR